MSSHDDATTYGSWEKDRVLGVGGFGIVTLWKNTNTDKYLALKKCRWDNVGVEMVSKKQKGRWSKEVDIMKRLSHRNVVRSIPLPSEFQSMISELPILCMEFCALGDLRQVLNKPENCCGLQEIEVKQIIGDIKSAVAYLHKMKITHRDLKPENIVLQRDDVVPGGITYKLIDLGYAKELDQSSICNSFVGTLQYLAPELYLNSVYTSSVDYWSLGLVSHEVITGVRPFFPNMSPPEWITHVEKKDPGVICAYHRAEDNSIVFKKELFKENHISEYLRVQLEKWLMVALEWNPDKRGKANSELVIFKMINEIFDKKIVLVFCVKTYKRLSYEVDSATSVSTLKNWIKRDTSQPVPQQLLLLPSGEKMTDDKFAISCWDPSVQDVMLYVLPINGLDLPRNVSPYFPELVQFLLKNSKESVPFQLKRRMWANAVYFIYQELFLYQCYIDAYAVKMLWLVSFSQQLRTLFQELNAKLQDLKGAQCLAQQSLDCDQRYFLPMHSVINRTSPHQKQLFGNYEQMIILHCEKLKQELLKQGNAEEVIRNVGDKITKSEQKVTLLQMFLEPSKTKLPEMKNALKAGYKNYMNLMSKKKQEQFQNSSSNVNTNEQSSKSNSFDMFKLVYNFLKVRDKALNDEEFTKHLSDLNACELELTALENQLQSLLFEMKASSDRLVNTHLKRQEELWSLVKKLSHLHVDAPPRVPQGTSIANNIHVRGIVDAPYSNHDEDKNANHKISEQELIHQSHVQPVNMTPINTASEQRQLTTSHSLPNGAPVSFMIGGDSFMSGISLDDVVLDEHLTLRCDLVECMSRAHETIQSIKNEAQSMDWKSLYE